MTLTIHKPTINASMQIYNQHTGEFEALLLDEAFLTNSRTGAASAIVAKYFASESITAIGILGTGEQAKFQMIYLHQIYPNKKMMIWGRNQIAANKLKDIMAPYKFNIEIANSIQDVTSKCNLIITATSASQPIIYKDDVQPATLIISIGADTKNKHEVDVDLLKIAGLVISDSKSQCEELGNIAHALPEDAIKLTSIIELGDAIIKNIRRKNNEQIIVANPSLSQLAFLQF